MRDRATLQRVVQEGLSGMLELWIERQHQIAAHAGLALSMGGEDAAAVIGQLHLQSTAAAQQRFILPLDARSSHEIVGVVAGPGTALKLLLVQRAEMPEDVCGQRTAAVGASGAVDDLHARVTLRTALDLGHDRQGEALGHDVVVELLGHGDRGRGRVVQRCLQRFDQQATDPGPGRLGGERRVGVGRFGGAAAVDAPGDPLHPGLDAGCAAVPLFTRQTAQLGQPGGKLGTFGQHAVPFGRQPLRVAALGRSEPRAGDAAEPGGIGRLLQIAVVDRQGEDLLVAGQDGPVAGEDAAPHAGQAPFSLQGPGRFGAKGRPLGDLELHRPAEDDQQQQQESAQADPQAPARIDHGRRG